MNNQKEKLTQIEVIAVLNTFYQEIENLKQMVDKFYGMFELLKALLVEKTKGTENEHRK